MMAAQGACSGGKKEVCGGPGVIFCGLLLGITVLVALYFASKD